MILRLPEERDYFGDGPDPISTYYSTKKSNEGFFQKSADKKIDLNKFGRTNYLTAPKNSVGVASH
jgi:hypothetical protein